MAAGIELSPTGAAERAVKPGDFITLSYVVKNNSSSDDNVSFTYSADPALSLLSEPKPVLVPAGASKKIAVTVSVSGAVNDKQSMPFTLTAASSLKPGATAAAMVTLLSDAKVCASMDDLPESVPALGREAFTLEFTVANCGSNTENFSLYWEPGKGMVFTETPTLDPLAPGESKKVRFNILPTINTNDYVSVLKIRVLKKKFPVAEKIVKIMVKKPALNVGGAEFPLQFIRINAETVNLFTLKSDTQSSVHLTVPLIANGPFSFRSDVWMDNVEDRDFRTRQKLFHLGYGRHGLALGTQQAPLSEVFNSRSELDGFNYTRNMGSKGWFSFFNGSDDIGEMRMARWDRPLTNKFNIGYENIYSKTWRNDNSIFRANSINARYKPVEKLNLTALIADSRMNSDIYPDGRSERKARLGAYFNDEHFNTSIIYNSNPNGFSTSEQQKGIESSSNLYYRSFTFSNFIQRNTYRYSLSDGTFADIPYRYEYRLAGWGKSLKKPKLWVYAASQSTFYNTFNENENGTFKNVHNNTYTYNIGRQASKYLYIGIGEQRDNERAGSYVRNTRRYTIDANFNRKKLNVITSFVGALNFASVDTVLTAERIWTTTADYRFNPKNTLHVETKKEYRGFSSGGSQNRLRLSVEMTNRLSPSDDLWTKYEYVDERDSGNSESWVMAYTRRLGVKIPYKKFGSLKGKAFLDRNFDGIFNADDLPLNNIVFSIADKFFVTSEQDGTFEFLEMAPGTYRLAVDPNSSPVGVYPAATGPVAFIVKSAKQTSIDFPFQFRYRIGGYVMVEGTSDDYFSKNAVVSPASLRLVLLKDGAVIKETFSDREGNFYFENVDRGVYRVAVDPEWMPRNTVLKGTSRFVVACGTLGFPPQRYAAVLPGATAAIDITAKESGSADYLKPASVASEDTLFVSCAPAEPCNAVEFKIALRGREIVKTLSN